MLRVATTEFRSVVKQLGSTRLSEVAVWARSGSKRWLLKHNATFKAIGLKLRKVLVLKTEGPCGTLETKTTVLRHFFNSS